MITTAFFDTCIRAATIIIRGIFILIAAKLLNNQDFGLYITITAIIGILQYVIAGDYCYVAHRELLSHNLTIPELLKTQTPLIITLSLATIPIILLTIPKNTSPSIIAFSIIILLFESISNELQRHLAITNKFTSANIVLFAKSAGWIIPILIYSTYTQEKIELSYIFTAWTLGLIASISISAYLFKNESYKRAKIRIDILKKYIKCVPVILIGTIATRLMFSVDKIIIEKNNGLEIAGIYGLYAGMAMAFVAILDAGILTRSHPKLVQLSRSDPPAFTRLAKIVQTKTIATTTLAVFAYFASIKFILTTLGKIHYQEYSIIGAILIVSYGVYSLSFPANCMLYSNKKDTTISFINIATLLPLGAAIILQQKTPQIIAWAIFTVSAMHYISKTLITRHGNKNGIRSILLP